MTMQPDFLTVVHSGSEEKRPRKNVYGTQEANELVAALHREADEYRERSVNGMSLVAQWTQNGHRFLGNHYHTMNGANALVEGYRVILFSNDAQTTNITGLRRATLNRVQTGVISNVAGQTQQEIVVRWLPQETGDPERVWLKRSGARKLMGMVQQVQQQAAQMAAMGDPNAALAMQQIGILSTLTPAQVGDPMQGVDPFEPLNEDHGDYVKALVESKTLDDDDVVVVNDRLRADVAQEMFDNRWHLAQGDAKVVMNEYLCNIFGHSPMRLQWDDQKHVFRLENTHILNVWIDPKCESIDEAEYVIFDHLSSVDKAVAMYPEWEEDIRRAGETGPLSEKDGRRAAPWKATDFQRLMVVIRTTWVRHQRVPLTVDEALQAGVIQPAMTDPQVMSEPAEADPLSAVVPDGMPVHEAMESPAYEAAEHESAGESRGVPGEAVMPADEPVGDMSVGAGIAQTDAAVAPQPVPVLDEEGNPVYVLTETGELTAPDNDNWPKKIGLREIVSLPSINVVLADRECAYSDIPMAWNVNIPIMYSPYGQGEPQRLEDLQIQVNRLFSIMMNHAGYYQAPQRYWRASTLENIRRHGFQIHSRPGAEVPIPDMDYDRMVASGQACITQDIPILPPVYMNLFDRMLEELDRMIGNVDVRQGVAPTGITSGKAIDSLRSEAAGPLAFKAKFTEWMVERIAKIAMKAIVDWTPESEWQKVFNRYSLPVLGDIISGIDPDMMNVVAEVTTGRGTSREQDEQRAIQMYAGGAPGRLISRQTAMQKIRVPDPASEARQIDEEDRQRAMLTAPVQAAEVDNRQAEGNQ